MLKEVDFKYLLVLVFLYKSLNTLSSLGPQKEKSVSVEHA